MFRSIALNVTAHLAPTDGICLLAVSPEQALSALARMDPVPHVGRLADQVARMEEMFGIRFRGAIGVAALSEEEPDAE